MKIIKFLIYQVDLPLKEGPYNFASGKNVSTFDSTILQVKTDVGIEGFGEVCPLGSQYLPSYAEGVRTGLKKLLPHLIGENPLNINQINDLMDYLLKGHPYVKSAVDMACWDILGKHAKLPVCTLLGGRYGESIVLYRALSQKSPTEMAHDVNDVYKHYKKFQLKLGGDVQTDIDRIKACTKDNENITFVCDANTGWLPYEAMRFVEAVKDLNVCVEQPCATYDECVSVRNHTNKPFILDENIDCIDMLIRTIKDHTADIVNLKISKFGGLTRVKQARDLCVSYGIAMTIEDTWGSDIVTAAIAHLAHSTPEKYRFSSTDFNSYNSVSIADGAPCVSDGYMKASTEHGLGIYPKFDVLGSPSFIIE